MQTIRKKGTVILYAKNGRYGVLDLETQEYVIDETPYLQLAKEPFDHFWRRKYSPMRDQMPDLFADDPDPIY